jgi:hypothetical protein
MPKHRRSSGSPRRAALPSVALAVAALSTVALAGPADAAKGGANASSLQLVVLSSDSRTADASVTPAHGDEVTFDVKTSVDRPFVGLRCWQGDNFVYDAYVGYFPGYYDPTPSFTLDSGYWAAGQDATCTARLIYWNRQGREDLLATTTFAVSG